LLFLFEMPFLQLNVALWEERFGSSSGMNCELDYIMYWVCLVTIHVTFNNEIWTLSHKNGIHLIYTLYI
jgi:hypothetical protein